MSTPCSGQRLAACLAASLFVANAFAATIHATVKDSSGKFVSGVAVTLLDSNGKQVAAQTTDVKGVARFADIPAGHYTVASGDARSTPVDVAQDAEVAVTLAASVLAQIPKLEVTAARLKEARIALSPKIGTTVYTLDQQLVAEYGMGENTPMNEVLLRFPGIAQDSKASGSIHVRDEHANVQYRINGIQLPEGISGFGQSVDSRFVDRIDFVTGAVPAQYGLRTAGIVDIETKDGSSVFWPAATTCSSRARSSWDRRMP